MADQSMWKKEVSFARTSDEQARETDDPERPIWKQELSFVRKIKRDDDAEETTALEPAAEEPTDEDKPESTRAEVPVEELDEEAPSNALVVELPVGDVPFESEPEAVAEEPVEEHEDEAPTEPSVEPATVVELPLALAPVEPEPEPGTEEPVEEEPMWMRAVTFGSKAESQEPTGDEASVAPAPVVELPAAAAPVESEVEAWSSLPWLPSDAGPPTESEPEPVWVHASKREGLPLVVGGCTALLVVALLGALFMMDSGKITSGKRNLAALNRQVAALTPPNAERQRPPAEQRAHVSALTTALASRVSWDRVFRDVSLALPEDVRLTSLTGGTAPPKLTIRGRTPWYQSLDRLLSGLRGEPDLTNVQLTASTHSKVGGRTVVEFLIAADVASPKEGGS